MSTGQSNTPAKSAQQTTPTMSQTPSLEILSKDDQAKFKELREANAYIDAELYKLAKIDDCDAYIGMLSQKAVEVSSLGGALLFLLFNETQATFLGTSKSTRRFCDPGEQSRQVHRIAHVRQNH